MKSHQLDWISIEGFKSIANSGKIELRPINLVIGANGSGKSNLIEAFSLIQTIQDGFLSRYVKLNGGADELLHFGRQCTHSMTLEVWPKAEGAFFKHTLETDSLNQLFHEQSLNQQAWDAVSDVTHSWRLFDFSDTGVHSKLRTTAQTKDNYLLRANGSNLAAFLYRLQEKFPSHYGMIVKTIRRIAPFFDTFVLEPDNLNSEFINLIWTHKGTDKYFGASALSDGTLRFIALSTLLLQPLELRPSVILIDEPELGLHPEAIGLLASLIKLASVDTQIIAATQSPLLLDHFEPKDVLVAERVNGGTVFNRLNADKLAVWLEDYSLGQLWEKNEIGGNPLPETSK